MANTNIITLTLFEFWQNKSLTKYQGYIDNFMFVCPCFSPPLCGSLWCCILYVHFWGSVQYAACTLLSAAGASEQSSQVCTEQKSTMNESSSAGARESTWSSGQQMKMENCYHLLGPFKYMQAGEVGRSWWMPRVSVVVDMIKKIPAPPTTTTTHSPP